MLHAFLPKKTSLIVVLQHCRKALLHEHCFPLQLQCRLTGLRSGTVLPLRSLSNRHYCSSLKVNLCGMDCATTLHCRMMQFHRWVLKFAFICNVFFIFCSCMYHKNIIAFGVSGTSGSGWFYYKHYNQPGKAV